jgi:GntR family transcriptional regulator/MocR family aminotransferase
VVGQLQFDRASAVPFHRQIYEGYRAAILTGAARPGQQLPPTRALAEELEISRLPVLRAYEQLLHEGYTEGRVGLGTFVAEAIPDTVEYAGSAALPRATVLRRSSPRRGHRVELPSTMPPHWQIFGPFREGLPALDAFPHRVWARLLRRHGTRMTAELMAYGEAVGHGPLRAAIADHLRAKRAVRCEPSQVLVVSGAQMAIVIAALALLGPDDVACREEPGYPGARHGFGLTGRPVVPIPVDAAGIDVDRLAAVGRRARLVYVTPSHQYPLGATLSPERRGALLGWAERNDSWIVEDDYDRDYRYVGRPPPALQSDDTADRVIYIGSFSKVMFPSLRIGYVVVPERLVEPFVRVRVALDVASSTLDQAVLADFIDEGHLDRHVRRTRNLYLARRDELVRSIDRHARDLLTVVHQDAGTQLTAFLPAGVDDREVVRLAAERGVSANPLSRYYMGEPRSGLVLGFAGGREDETDRALRTLTNVVRGLMR